jgi:hypothetical protein
MLPVPRLPGSFMRKIQRFSNAFVATAFVDGAMTIVCPFSGLLVCSRHAFPIAVDSAKQVYVFYRFISTETFYVVVGNFLSSKFIIYHPRTESVVFLHDTSLTWGGIAEVIAMFRRMMVERAVAVADYIGSDTAPALLLDSINNLGHSLWNDLSAIYNAANAGLLSEVRKGLRYRYRFLPGHEVAGINLELVDAPDAEQLFEKALSNRLFCLRPAAAMMTPDIAARMRDTARRLCSPEAARLAADARRAELLVWINLRSHNKVWSNQVEGIVAIGRHLVAQGLRISFFFDGTPDCAALLAQIAADLPESISVYDGLNFSLADSITFATMIDFYVATIGSGLTLVTWVAEKPGIAHSETSHLTQMEFWPDVQPGAPRPLTPSAQDIFEEGSGMYCNYRIAPEVMISLVDQVLGRVSPSHSAESPL